MYIIDCRHCRHRLIYVKYTHKRLCVFTGYAHKNESLKKTGFLLTLGFGSFAKKMLKSIKFIEQYYVYKILDNI